MAQEPEQTGSKMSDRSVAETPQPETVHPLDKSVQYRRQRPATGEIGVYLEHEANARSWVKIPTAAWLTVIASSLLALFVILGVFLHRDILTVVALAAAALVSVGLPRTVGAPAARCSSAVALVFSLTSVITVRILDDLYIAGIICALSVVGAFLAEMMRKDGRTRLVDSISATVLTTVAATCAVALVGLAPQSSWQLALMGAAICVALSALTFQIMRLFWPDASDAAEALRTYEVDTARWVPNTWSLEGSDEYTAVQAVTYYWMLTETARTFAVIITGVIGALAAGLMYAADLLTGQTLGVMVRISDILGITAIGPILIGLGAGLLSGAVVQLGNRIVRPTNPRVSLWGAIAWGVLPAICMALPTYALVRLSGA
ncbi:hypothetical protein [Boudabousia marimammalium]|uniref:Uncharacterized protein n=1 Tax=Boudabousia marimammalium TaxID=156892 RepID=A0A1Q5PMB6_9ACTO|nr:hypothetical protein [Boudabousia marimammalium]OKL48677.1 hypothetical protein BM477_05625 [Boudabousia marimammalium]